MTLPASGTLTLLEVQTEFGGPGNLIAYHRGGSYVANTSTNQGIPTSGVIRLEQFYGASKLSNTVAVTVSHYNNDAGYNQAAIGGSVSPTTVGGHGIEGIYFTYSANRVYLGLNLTSNTPSGIFTSMTVYDIYNNARKFTYSTSSGYMNYSYGTVGTNVGLWSWSADDSGNNTFNGVIFGANGSVTTTAFV